MQKKIMLFAAAAFWTIAPLEAGKDVAPATAPVAPVAAPAGLYAGVGLTGSFFSKDCPCADGSRIHDNTYGVALRMGYDWSPYLGIEGQAHWAPLESDFMKMRNLGLYLKPQYDVTDQLNLYGLLGYGWTRFSCDCPDRPHHTHSVNGFQYGAGFEYFLQERQEGEKHEGWSIWGNYLNLMHKKTHYNFSDNVWAIGIGYHF